MFIDVGCYQLKKAKQNAYGDYFLSKRDAHGRTIAVLSDGLGSGIKANILSCMTATMLVRFLEKEVPIKEAAEIIMNSLPVCQVRQISYATFSAVEADEQGNIRIVEEGNPSFVWMHGDTPQKADYTEIVSRSFPNRRMKVYQFQVEQGDRLIFCSDGVTQAGMGEKDYPLGFEREGLLSFLQSTIAAERDISSSQLARLVVDKALFCEYQHKSQDDISSAVLTFRQPRKALVFTGPPYEKHKDREYAWQLVTFAGKRAICGGTTANIVSRELKREITTPVTTAMGALPPLSYMEDVDLITEGILTLTKAQEYLEEGRLNEADAAGSLVEFLLSSDIIEFMVGAMINQAHYDPALPIEIEIRRTVIKNIKRVLEEKYFKQVNIHYV
ncbi:MAG: SpoIIE family protein phosphatase [Alphaproteobacteria bacterium]|nr:SpoIIE family protein phosphatase [Alphaproteobacteria bacterium]